MGPQTKRDDDETPEQTIRELAKDALDRAKGNVLKATERMAKEVGGNPRLYKELMDPLVRNACYRKITEVCRTERRVIWNMRQPTAEEQQNNIVALARGVAATLFDFTLPGGQRLGDAKRDEVAEAAEFYHLQGADMMHKWRWLRLISQHLQDERTVADSLDEARLEELKAEAERNGKE